MTQTLEPHTATVAEPAVTPPSTPQERVEQWFAQFEEALRTRDVDRATGYFATKCFWRDLVAFSWNITTVENPDGVTDLLTATLDSTDPSGFAVDEPPEEADGVTTLTQNTVFFAVEDRDLYVDGGMEHGLRASMQPGAGSFRRALAHILTAAAERLEPEATHGVASAPANAH